MISEEKMLLNIKYVFGFLYVFLKKILFLRRIERHIIKNLYCSSSKVPNIFVRFQ